MKNVQYGVHPPLVLMTASTLRLIPPVYWRICLMVKFCHSRCRTASSSRRFCTGGSIEWTRRRHKIPNMLKWVEIRAHGGPRHTRDCIFLQAGPYSTWLMMSGIIVHEDRPCGECMLTDNDWKLHESGFLYPWRFASWYWISDIGLGPWSRFQLVWIQAWQSHMHDYIICMEDHSCHRHQNYSCHRHQIWDSR